MLQEFLKASLWKRYLRREKNASLGRCGLGILPFKNAAFKNIIKKYEFILDNLENKSTKKKE